MKQQNKNSIKKTSVLFVCLGNICRSPTGEAVLKKHVKNLNCEDQFHIESAGTAAYHIGERPDPRTIKHGENRGLEFTSLAQQFQPQIHFEQFDFILCMDESNYQNILRLDAQKKYHEKVFLMMNFAPDLGYKSVPDPYTGGPRDFELVIDLLEQSTQQFLKIHKIKNP